ncbi:MAG: hypothetical protein LBK25_07975 [Treponema sp.]|nr:hypothetical protein [Treponema sp.]
MSDTPLGFRWQTRPLRNRLSDFRCQTYPVRLQVSDTPLGSYLTGFRYQTRPLRNHLPAFSVRHTPVRLRCQTRSLQSHFAGFRYQTYPVKQSSPRLLVSDISVGKSSHRASDGRHPRYAATSPPSGVRHIPLSSRLPDFWCQIYLARLRESDMPVEKPPPRLQCQTYSC